MKMKAVVDEIRSIRTEVFGIPVLRPRLEEIRGGGAQPFGILNRLTEMRGQPSREEMYEVEEGTEEIPRGTQLRPAETPQQPQAQLQPQQQIVSLIQNRPRVLDIIRQRLAGLRPQPAVQQPTEEADLDEQEWEKEKKKQLQLRQQHSIEM